MDRDVPHGWFSALRTVDLKGHRASGFRAFDRDFAAWRDAQGGIHVLDGYCPHRGGSLAKGRVDTDGLRCPLHEWCFGADGRCTKIPCAPERPTPTKAQVRSYPAREAYGVIWFYCGPGEPPAFPACPEFGRTDYGPTSSLRIETETHPFVPLENALDPLRATPVPRKTLQGGDIVVREDRERLFSFSQRLRVRALGRSFEIRNDVAIHDGSIQTGLFHVGEREVARWVMVATPVDERRVAIVRSVVAKRAPIRPWLRPDPLAIALRQGLLRGVRVNERIWRHQRREMGTVVLPEDQAAERFRQHYARMVENDHRSPALRERAAACHPASHWARVEPQMRRARPSQ